LDGATGTTPVSGAGTRMMWIPAAGAARFGIAVGDEWDDASIGIYSFASGSNAKASHRGSFASGYGQCGGCLESSDLGSFAQGYSRVRSSATASRIEASGQGSFAQGYAYAFRPGGEGLIISSGGGSFAQGRAAGTEILKKIESSGQGSFAHGYTQSGNIVASANNSMAIGDDVTASASNSIVFGLSCTNATANSFRIGWSANGGIHIKNQELWFKDNDAIFALDAGTTNGLQIGKTSSQKLGFFGKTPATQRLKTNYNNWASTSDVVNALVDLGLFDQA